MLRGNSVRILTGASPLCRVQFSYGELTGPAVAQATRTPGSPRPWSSGELLLSIRPRRPSRRRRRAPRHQRSNSRTTPHPRTTTRTAGTTSRRKTTTAAATTSSTRPATRATSSPSSSLAASFHQGRNPLDLLPLHPNLVHLHLQRLLHLHLHLLPLKHLPLMEHHRPLPLHLRSHLWHLHLQLLL